MRNAKTCAPLVGGAAALLVALCGLAGCSSPTTGEGPTSSGSPLSVRAPLDATLATGSAVFAVVPMGKLSDRNNTFWQLFSRPPTSTGWVLVTPAGVADNGGLVVSTDPDGAGGTTPTLAGFEPSQALGFSPLASSVNRGGSWAPGLVPGALAAVPDALATSSAAGSVALLRAGRGEVFKSSGDPAAWSRLVSRDAIASSGPGRSCGVGELAAVGLDGARGVEVGTSCTSPGVVGIFGVVGGAWRLVAPRLSGPLASSPTKVLRLVDRNGATSALLAVRSKSRTSVMAVAGTDGGAWARSVPLPIGADGRIASTGVEPGGGFVVLVSRSNGSLALDMEKGPGADWQALAPPPRGTATVSVGTGGEVDALAVASTSLTDWRLDAPAGTWSKIGTVTVPVQFGSSA